MPAEIAWWLESWTQPPDKCHPKTFGRFIASLHSDQMAIFCWDIP
jgi:hypothetical protein